MTGLISDSKEKIFLPLLLQKDMSSAKEDMSFFMHKKHRIIVVKVIATVFDESESNADIYVLADSCINGSLPKAVNTILWHLFSLIAP